MTAGKFETDGSYDALCEQRGSWIYFRIVSDRELSREDLWAQQARFGYMPEGYGFYSLLVAREGTRWSYNWKCSPSCD